MGMAVAVRDHVAAKRKSRIAHALILITRHLAEGACLY